MSNSIKLVRGDDVKYVSAWALEDCKALGWVVEGEEQENDDKDPAAELMKLSKPKLVDFAKEKNIEVTADNNKAEIVAKILAAA